MSRDRKIVSIFMVASLFLLAIFCSQSEATLNLDVSPVRGGSSLRFGRVDVASAENREVRIRVTSDEGNQYQIFQSMIQPLTNEKGEFLHASALETYAITGSNSLGSLYLQQITTMKSVDDLLYSSNATGESDSLTMVYAINPAEVDMSGRFSGKILYTLRPVSGGSQKQGYLDVFLEISQDFKIQTQASSGLDTVRLNPKNPKDAEGYLNISFSGNVGEKINVYQELDRLPTNDAGQEIGKDVLRFSVSGSKEGDSPYATPTDFTKRMMIYSSQKASDDLVVHFLFNEEALAGQKAGVYRGQIKYIFEKPSGLQTVFLNVEITVEPVFEIQVSFPEGEPRFQNLLPDSPPQVKQAFVEVKTNLGRPYMVIQKIPAPLANEKGTIFKQENFDMKVENLEGVGKSNFNEFEAVSQEEKTIFFSNPKGDPCKAKVFYRLKPYPGMDPGDYLMSIVYSLGEM